MGHDRIVQVTAWCDAIDYEDDSIFVGSLCGVVCVSVKAIQKVSLQQSNQCKRQTVSSSRTTKGGNRCWSGYIRTSKECYGGLKEDG